MSKKGFTTTTLHSDRYDHPEHGAVHKAVHNSVAYHYDDARELADVFQGKSAGHVYARQGNPTTQALEQKITHMENAVGSVCFGSGMAAISSMLLALLKTGDHIVSSVFLFGNTNSLFSSFEEQGIAIDYVDATDVDNVAAAITATTRMVFVETIANPRTQVADLEKIGQLCAQKGLVYVVDNTMTSPYLFQAKQVQASLVVNSLTKYIGGHGNALGGSISDTGCFDWTTYPNIFAGYKKQKQHMWGLQQIKKKGLRDMGGALAPEAAHHISVGSETLALRLQRACANALELAQFFHQHSGVSKVYYPGLAEHPQHDLAAKLFRHSGALLSIEIAEQLDVFEFLNRLQLVISSSNLGDNRTLAIPVAHTIYYEMGAQRRASMGIADSLIRISVGIEDSQDLIEDFSQALES